MKGNAFIALIAAAAMSFSAASIAERYVYEFERDIENYPGQDLTNARLVGIGSKELTKLVNTTVTKKDPVTGKPRTKFTDKVSFKATHLEEAINQFVNFEVIPHMMDPDNYGTLNYEFNFEDWPNVCNTPEPLQTIKIDGQEKNLGYLVCIFRSEGNPINPKENAVHVAYSESRPGLNDMVLLNLYVSPVVINPDNADDYDALRHDKNGKMKFYRIPLTTLKNPRDTILNQYGQFFYQIIL